MNLTLAIRASRPIICRCDSNPDIKKEKCSRSDTVLKLYHIRVIYSTRKDIKQLFHLLSNKSVWVDDKLYLFVFEYLMLFKKRSFVSEFDESFLTSVITLMQQP